MAYRVQHGMAPAYLNQLVPVSDLPGRRRLRSSSTLELFVPAATVWNTLPVHVQSSPSISTFRQRLKTFLSQQSFPDIIIWHYWLCYRGLHNGYSDWLIDSALLLLIVLLLPQQSAPTYHVRTFCLSSLHMTFTATFVVPVQWQLSFHFTKIVPFTYLLGWVIDLQFCIIHSAWYWYSSNIPMASISSMKMMQGWWSRA